MDTRKSQISNFKSQKKLEIGNWKLEILCNSGVAGLVLATQVMFDPRIVYITMIAVMGYYLINKKFQISSIRQAQGKFQIISILYTFIIPGLIAGLLHAVWILPVLFLQSNPDPQGLTSVDGFRFLSFADFSQSISSLHPNWPENIFGKVGFMKPEFLALPILAYTSLLFIKNPKSEIRNPKQILNTKY